LEEKEIQHVLDLAIGQFLKPQMVLNPYKEETPLQYNGIDTTTLVVSLDSLGHLQLNLTYMHHSIQESIELFAKKLEDVDQQTHKIQLVTQMDNHVQQLLLYQLI